MGLAGSPFGRYRLLDRIGGGGMAEVFRAVLDGPQGFSRTVVIKRILPNLAHDDTFLRLFLDEARISALLHHPAIVQTFDFGAVDGTYFLTMELIDGWTLSTVMQLCKQRLTAAPIADVCYAMSELAGALAYAHALTDESGRPLEIVHRDISPSNIMISRQGSVKLLDFGIARAAERVRDERTRSGTRKGKLSYMSPEQTSAAIVDRRADIFSLGIVFYEWLTMRRLFKRDDEIKTVLAIRNDPIVAPSVHTGIPPDLDALVMKMLARDPRERYQSCDDVVTDLVPIVQRLGGHTQTLRAFVQNLKAPGVDGAAADSGPRPGTAIANQSFAPEPCRVVVDHSVEPTLLTPTRPADLASGVVTFHGRPWWRRLSADDRIVIAAGGVALALALVLASLAWVARSSHVGGTPLPANEAPAAERDR